MPVKALFIAHSVEALLLDGQPPADEQVYQFDQCRPYDVTHLVRFELCRPMFASKGVLYP